MRRTRILTVLLMVLLLVPTLAFAQTWPNEPSGATTIVDCNFSTMDCGYPSSVGGGGITTDATAPLSPTNVLRYSLPVGQSNGGGEVYFVLGPQPLELYTAYWWKPSNPFQGHPNCSNKVHGVISTGGNIWLDMHCGSPGGPYIAKLILQIPQNNCHVTGNGNFGDCPGTYTLFPNQSSGAMSLGAWHLIEQRVKASSGAATRDGHIELWIDGVLAFRYLNVNMPDPYLYTVFTPTWDGSWTPVHSTSFSHSYDHVHISTGGIPGSSDTTPPPQVTGLVVQPLSNSATITWTGVVDNSGIPVNYHVERCQGTSCVNFSLIGTTTSTSTTHSGLSANTTYRWRVRAVDSSNNLGAYSSIVTATTAPAGGSNTILSITSNGQFALNGVSKFLLGVSYYDCANFHTSDVDSYVARQFNLFVCHADDIFAGSFPKSLYTTTGALVPAIQNQIEAFIDYADSVGAVVDINCLYADTDGSNSAVHLTTVAARNTAITNCINAFKANNNVIFSIINEHNIGAFSRSETDVGNYYNVARAACPTCIIFYSSTNTASAVVGDGGSHVFTTQAGSTVNTTVVNAELANNISVFAPHNNRNSGWHLLGAARAGNLRAYLDTQGRQAMPLLFEVDAHEGSGGTGVYTDYITYAQDVKLAGAAGYVQTTASGFDLDSATAFSQHTAVETNIFDNIGSAVFNATEVVRDTPVHTNACAGTAADIGADWDAGYTNHDAWQTVSDRCRTAGIGSKSLESYNGAIENNQWIEYSVPTFTMTGTYTEIRAQVRLAAPADVQGYECRAGKINDGVTTAPNGIVRITREDGAALSPSILAELITPLTAPFTFACEVVGSTITAYVDSVAVLSAQDTTYSTGRPAFHGESDASATDIEVDDISLGNFTTVTPVAPAITSIVITATGATVNYSGNPAYIRVLTDLSNVVEPISSFPGNFYTRTWLPGETFVCFFARDANQVENTDPDKYQCGIPVIISDITPPVLSNPLPTGLLVAGTTSAQISITTNEQAQCRYNTTNVAFGNMLNTFSTLNSLFHVATVTGLSNGTAYTYYTRCQDQAGNANTTSTSITFSVDSPPSVDTTPPGTVTNLSGIVQSTSQIRLSWTPVVDVGGMTAYYNIYSCSLDDCSTGGSVIASPSGPPHTISGLSANTNYNFAVKAVDDSGNQSTSFSNVVSLTTQSTGDTVPPSAIPSIRVIGQPYQRVYISWPASVDASGILRYQIERCQGVDCTNFETIKNTQALTYTDTDVVQKKTYRYRVVAIDNNQNVGEYSPIGMVRVPATPGRDNAIIGGRPPAKNRGAN